MEKVVKKSGTHTDEDTSTPEYCCLNCPKCDASCIKCKMCTQCGNCAVNNRKNYTPVLVFLLFIALFALGVLVDKVSYLRAGTPAAAPTDQAAQGQQAAAPTVPAGPVNVAIGKYPVKGKSDAKVTIIEFADPRCPFCERFFTDTEPQIIKDYVDTGKAKFAFRIYSFLGPASDVASNAMACANEQGKFWEFHDYLYKNQPPETDTSMFTPEKLSEVAGTLGMNADQFKTCMTDNKYKQDVANDLADGQKAGVNGTPTVFINGIAVVGAQPYSAFKTIIDQELAK